MYVICSETYKTEEIESGIDCVPSFPADQTAHVIIIRNSFDFLNADGADVFTIILSFKSNIATLDGVPFCFYIKTLT